MIYFRFKDKKVVDEHCCIYGISHEYVSIEKTSYGIDLIQAIFSAMRQLNGELNLYNSRAKFPLLWEGGVDQGDFGLPNFIM